MGHYHDIITELRQPSRDLRAAIPDVWGSFGEMHRAAVSEGVLPARFKELIALAIAVIEECDGCIAYHARAAVHQGASEQEAAEALGVTLLMGGGPATIYAPRALEAFHEFAEAAAAKVPSG